MDKERTALRLELLKIASTRTADSAQVVVFAKVLEEYAVSDLTDDKPVKKGKSKKDDNLSILD